MKKTLIIMHLLVFSNFLPQFNTVSYQGKLNNIKVNNSVQNNFSSNFSSYHIEGKIKRKKIEKIKGSDQDSLANIKQIKDSEVISIGGKEESKIDSEDDTNPQKNLIKKRYRNKKLTLIENRPYTIEELQIVYMPLENMRVTSSFGTRFHPIDKVEKFHSGVDLRADNNYVFAVLDGTVSDVGHSNGAGNYIKVRHGDFETSYLHLSKTFFSYGDIIYAGDIIAISGNTGKSTAPHLHFAVKENGRYINPIRFLNDLIQTNNALADYNYGKY